MKRSREEIIENAARSEFETAINFGVSLDNFARLAAAMYEAGAAKERVVSDRLLDALKKSTKALGDLSFECDGVIGYCSRPSVPTYNRTFDDLQSVKKTIAEVEAMRKENKG